MSFCEYSLFNGDFVSERDIAIETAALSREFQVRKKEEGLFASIKGFFNPDWECISAVADLDLTVYRGEMIGFLGPNGAGKTTTLKMMSGLILPTSGTISVLNENPFNRSREFLMRISLVMGQKQNLWWDLPPSETYALHREIYGISASDYSQRLDELVEMLEIKDCLHIQARKLSLGQRMRCELAAALLHNPEILFLDEPTIGLDILMQQKIRRFIIAYHEKFRPTVLLTSHYMADVEALAQRVVVINKGRKVFDGSLASLHTDSVAEKILTVIFREIPAGFDYSDYGKLILSENNKFKIGVSKAKAPQIAAKLYAGGGVEDLSLEEPPLEEVIGRLFRGIE